MLGLEGGVMVDHLYYASTTVAVALPQGGYLRVSPTSSYGLGGCTRLKHARHPAPSLLCNGSATVVLAPVSSKASPSWSASTTPIYGPYLRINSGAIL